MSDPNDPSPADTSCGDSVETEGAFQRGLQIRKAVLGEAHVQRSLDNASDFDREIQHFVTEFGWGRFWTRDGLDRKTKSLITVSMLVALGKPHELGVHVRGALNNGVSVDELKDALFHSMLYCGAPATLEAFRVARQVVEAWTAERAGSD